MRNLATKYIYLCILGMVCGVSAWGDGDVFRVPHTGGDAVSMPSVEASALCRHLQHDVNYSTGQAIITLPLYTLNCGDLSLPLSLRYTTAAVKVDDDGGVVGVGWDLEYGGIVSRRVVGCPDEIYQCAFPKEEPTLDYLKDVDSYKADTGYDVYNYRAGDSSGSFIIIEDNIILLPQKDERIIRGNNGNFHIVTADGTEYVYDITETMSYRYLPITCDVKPYRPDYDNVGCSWRISRIINASRTDSIMFEYVDLPSRDRYSVARLSGLSACNLETNFVHLSDNSSNRDLSQNRYTYGNRHGLSRIVSRAGIINFIDPQQEPLQGFTVNAPDGTEVRRVKFDYINYRNTSISNVPLLTDVTVTVSGVKVDGASMTYHDPELYMGNRDIFGYNNYKNGTVYTTTSVLDVVLPEDTTSQSFPLLPIDPDNIEVVTGEYSVGSSSYATQRGRIVIARNKLPDFEAMVSMTLKTITTFAGATTEFDYEPNEAEQHFSFDGTVYDIAPGIRIKREKITDMNNGNVRVKDYAYSGGRSTIDFGKLDYGVYVGLSGMRRVLLPHLKKYYSTSAVALASSRMPGAAVEDAAVYYSDVRETITGTGLDAPVVTDYKFDLSELENKFVLAGKQYLTEAQMNDERYCGTKFIPQTHPLLAQAYQTLLSPNLIRGYFREEYMDKAPLVSKTEWEADSYGVPQRKIRTTDYCYSYDEGVEYTAGYYCDPLVRTCFDEQFGMPKDDFMSIDDFNYFPVKIYTARQYCDSMRVTEYDAYGISRTVTTAYEYQNRAISEILPRGAIGQIGGVIENVKGRLHLLSKMSRSSGGDSYVTEYQYSSNSLDPLMISEKARGRIALPVSEIFMHGSYSVTKRFNYKDFGAGKGGVQLSSRIYSVNGNNITDSITLLRYDAYGNPLEAVDFRNIHTVYTWGDCGTFLKQHTLGGYLSTKYGYTPLVGYSEITSPALTLTEYGYRNGRLASQSIAGEDVASYIYAQYGDSRVNKVVTSYNGVNGNAIAHVSRYDAFGNLLLSGVGIDAGNAGTVTMQEYDALGRKLRSYFPAAVDDTDSGIEVIQRQAMTAYDGDSKPFVQASYYPEGEGRTRTLTLGGDEFASHPVRFAYRFNENASDNDTPYSCRRYRLNGSQLVFDGYYGSGMLQVTETIDGDGRKSYLFKDFTGKTVLTRIVADEGNADTYHIYNDAGNVVVTLPPLASASLSMNGAEYDIDNCDAIRDYAYVYRYDGREQLVERRDPGAETVRFYYDKSGSMVFSQDGEQRSRGVVSFTIPDYYGRPAIEGEALAVPSLLAGVKDTCPYAMRTQPLSGRHVGYGVSISLQNVVIDKAYYYDDYSFLTETPFARLNNRLTSEPLAVKRSNNRGLLTGTLSRITSAADYDGSKTPLTANSEYTATVYGYDRRERVAQSVTVNSDGVAVCATTTYSASDLPLTVTTVRSGSDGGVSTVMQRYEYDNLDRQTAVATAVDGVAMARVETAYDDKGRVASDSMSDAREDYVNTLSYSYLTNGRAKSITSSSGKFGMTLGYSSGMYPSYSGNVSSMSWKGDDGADRIYNYRYDKLNRLVFAGYNEANRTSRGDIRHMGSPDYSTSYGYDLQGNVQYIRRKGMSSVAGNGKSGIIAAFGDIDLLAFDYSGNRLKSVTDAAQKVYYTGATDFDDGADEDSEYDYDYNGNMTADLNQGIANIVYNKLNLPAKIEFDNGDMMENSYDADGNLVRRIVPKNLSVVTSISAINELSEAVDFSMVDTVSYAGPWRYTNGVLDRINIPGGYIKSNNVYFYINDHQSNIRQVWNASTDKIVQDNHYYPYGSLFGESASTAYLNTLANPVTLTPITGETAPALSSNDITTAGDPTTNYMTTADGSSSPTASSAGVPDDTTGLSSTAIDLNDNSLANILRPAIGNEISDNAYRYGGKEWLTFRGLNAYDFTARLYDPSLGRFHNPDPLNTSYPQLSPNLYCAANPINATDPSGMIWNYDGLSDEEQQMFEDLKERYKGNEEVTYLFNYLEQSDKVYYLKFSDSLESLSVEGNTEYPSIEFTPTKEGGILSISKVNPPHLINLAEDLFHCFQNNEITLNRKNYDYEFEAKFFAQIVYYNNPYQAYYETTGTKKLLTYLGFKNFGDTYNSKFLTNLHTLKYYFLYITGNAEFVNYNKKYGIGNVNYRVNSNNISECIYKFYKNFKIP